MNGVVCLRSTGGRWKKGGKVKGGSLRDVNSVPAYFGTTEPDFSELK